MPVVLRYEGFRVAIYVNDHRPAHVHAFGGGGIAVFVLNCPDGPPTLRESTGLGKTELRRLMRTISRYVKGLCDQWRRLHEHY